MKAIIGVVLCAAAVALVIVPIVKTVGWKTLFMSLVFAALAIGWFATVLGLITVGIHFIML